MQNCNTYNTCIMCTGFSCIAVSDWNASLNLSGVAVPGRQRWWTCSGVCFPNRADQEVTVCYLSGSVSARSFLLLPGNWSWSGSIPGPCSFTRRSGLGQWYWTLRCSWWLFWCVMWMRNCMNLYVLYAKLTNCCLSFMFWAKACHLILSKKANIF